MICKILLEKPSGRWASAAGRTGNCLDISGFKPPGCSVSVCWKFVFFFLLRMREREKKLATSGLQMSFFFFFFFYCREPAGLYWGLTGNRNMQVICQDSPRTLSHTHFVPRPAIKLFIHSLYSLHRLYIHRSFLVCVVGNERFCN